MTRFALPLFCKSALCHSALRISALRISALRISALSLPILAFTACSQVAPPPSSRIASVTETGTPTQAPPPQVAAVADSPPAREAVVDYWLVAARPSDERAVGPGLVGVAGTVFAELDGQQAELALFDRITFRTASDQVARVDGSRSSVRHSREQSEVKLLRGAGEFQVQHKLRPGELTVLGKTTIEPPFGAPFYDDTIDRKRRSAAPPVTLVVLARERAAG